MSQETDALLRTILFQVLKAKSVKEILHAIKAMCNKDLIASVEKEYQEYKEDAE
jgi:DNA-binding cell septation regulator SpoVG